MKVSSAFDHATRDINANSKGGDRSATAKITVREATDLAMDAQRQLRGAHHRRRGGHGGTCAVPDPAAAFAHPTKGHQMIRALETLLAQFADAATGACIGNAMARS